MAGEVVGGALLSASLHALFGRIASVEMVNFFQQNKLDEGLLKKMKHDFLSAHAVLNDAEAKQIRNPAVMAWLSELQGAVYDAEDLVRVIDAETLQCKIEAPSHASKKKQIKKQIRNPGRPWSHELQTGVSIAERLVQRINFEALRCKIIKGDQYGSRSSHKVLNPFPLTVITSFNNIKRVESMMNEILDTLEFVLDEKVRLGLKEGVVQTISAQRLLPAISSSSVEEEDFGVYGRDDDKEAIIKLLVTDNGPSCNRISVIPIVGRGGIGKTTLAQLIYNDDRVNGYFDLKAWVSVSDDFNVFKITKTIAERVSNLIHCHYLDELQYELKKVLMREKFLLVLDDVQNEDYSLWEELKKPFELAAYGSKIIVTTRYESVASVMMNDIPSYQLQTISDENCWNLCMKHAFNNADPCAHPRLEEIGRQIVRKCKGLPLAVKLVGSILCYHLSLEEWENVLKSDMWEVPEEKNNILPALWLNYQYLPSHLKQCFAYCSVFPKNYQIDKEDLIKLWMAENLLKSDEKKMMEEVGEDYFHDLLSRSLLQQSTSSFGSICYTMHDLVHDLAAFIAGEFRLSLDDSDTNKHLSKVRHMSHVEKQLYDLKKYKDLSKVKCLRSFFFPSNCYGEIQFRLEKLVALMLPKFTSLRVLSFRAYSMKRLPDSIGNLKLLRYLNLSGSRIEKIPNTLCTLYNLQTLILSGCKQLRRLPTHMGKLINLRHLDITSTHLEMMPSGLDKLNDLQTLGEFVVGRQFGFSIGLLRNLQNLHGNLCFRGLENVMKVEDVLMANLKEKKYLTELDFHWVFKSKKIIDREVLNGLEPHTSMKILRIIGYGGERFPAWVGDPSFCNLEEISLEGCWGCNMLPPLGQLPFLKKLIIKKLNKLLKIGNEFYCGDAVATRPFRSLEFLSICDMPMLEEWSFVEGDRGYAIFPNLKQLRLSNCWELRAHICLPNTIEEVTIFRCKSLEWSGMQQHSYGNLRRLVVEKCDIMNSIALDDFPMLEELRLKFVENVESLKYAKQPQLCPPAFTSLTIIELGDCPELVSFPQGGLHAPNLKEFDIQDCEKLRSLPEHMNTLLPSLQSLSIWNCPQLEPFPEFSLPSRLFNLQITGCEKLFASRRQWDLQTLTTFSIGGIDDVLNSFPEEGLLPATLIHLTIHWLPHLKALNGKAFQPLSSLEELNISFCDELQYLPEEGLPASLSELSIKYCHLLTQRCQRMTGEDWPKIAHIPKVTIDHEDYEAANLEDDTQNTQEDVYLDSQDTNLKDDRSIAWRGDTDDIKNIQEEVFNRLQPHTELQKLNLSFWVHQKLHIQQYVYGAKSFPSWGGYGSFSCLVKLDLVYCKSCYCLPPLGHLPALKKLLIQGFDRVKRIGDEFYSTDTLSLSKPFKSLESLTFSHMLWWKEWSFTKSGVFSDLKQLTLDNCRKLEGTCFPTYLPSLQSLLILGCKKQVVASLSTDGLPLLTLLKIGHCKELESFPIRTLPANVHTVKIMGCKELVSLSEDGWPSKLKSLEISYCRKLFGNSLWWNLRTVTSLTSLQIIKIDEVVDSFPQEWQLPTTLKSLTLRHFRNLKSLNGKALQHHTSLKELKIEFCHHLHYLPEEGLPDSLSQLEIFGCDFLNGRCQKERGEDWPKISHIPRILIDCKEV